MLGWRQAATDPYPSLDIIPRSTTLASSLRRWGVEVTLQLPDQEPCYFCEIISGQTDQWNVIEDADLTITLLNGRQFEVGQCVILPVRHAPTLLDLTDQESGAIMKAAKRMANIMMRAFDPDGILLYQNNGIGSGQEVPHFHLHVVPRRPKNDWGLGPPHISRLEQEGRPAHVDHVVVTEAKRVTVETLRRYL